ncbi:MAG: hypothetical protein ACOVOV_07805 [Dolichospermum sp.]
MPVTDWLTSKVLLAPIVKVPFKYNCAIPAPVTSPIVVIPPVPPPSVKSFKTLVVPSVLLSKNKVLVPVV